MDGTPNETGRILVRAAIAVFAGSALFWIIVAISGGDPFDALDDIVLFCFAGAALLAIAGSAYERRAAAGHLSDAELKHDRLERRLQERQDALRHEQHTRFRVERARQAEREWARELREQVLALHRRQGATGATDDIRELVLRIAIELVGADKGLLLSREDGNHDGRLDLISHQGFEHDPGDSDVAQRFAERVLERDEIVRDDQPGAGRSPADKEIRCLVAVPVYINDAFEGAVVCANRPEGFEELDDDVLLALGDHAGAVMENTRLHADLRRTYLAVIEMLSDSIATKDPFDATYSAQISRYVEAVAKRLGLGGREREQLVFATLLRDIGKLGISQRVLLKPQPLSSEEWGVMALHPEIGCRIVERVPGLNEMGPTIRHHQERWDGRGYPSGLTRAEIPVAARIVAVAAAFGAMVEGRPYRPSRSVEAACREILRCAGTQFDPEVAEIFVAEVRRRPLHDSDEHHPVAQALDESAVGDRRDRGGPLLGRGPVGATDNVTLLYSHRFLLECAEFEAERARRRARPFAVVMVEVPDLASINRRDGYAAGDAALYDAARALEEAVAATSGIPGRYSGRRLAAIIPKSGERAGGAAAHELLRRLDGGPTVRTAVAVWQHGDHGETVLARAHATLERGAAVTL